MSAKRFSVVCVSESRPNGRPWRYAGAPSLRQVSAMTDSTLRLVQSDASVGRTDTSALRWARSLLKRGDRDPARDFLETSLATDVFRTSPQKATALLALALLARARGDRESALRLIDRAETALVLSENQWAIVRWDLLLARSKTLSDLGRTTESAACARTALALFNDSPYSIAWHHRLLVDLQRLALADDDACTPFLLPKALGALGLETEYDAQQWLSTQKAIIGELIDRGRIELAVDHVARTMCALPFDVSGSDRVWGELLPFMKRIFDADHEVDISPIRGAFATIDWEITSGIEHERTAPLLPRARIDLG